MQKPTAIDPEEDDKSAGRPSDTTDNDYRSPEPESDEDDDNDSTEKPTGKSRRNLFIWGGLAAIAAVIALVIFLPQFTGPSDTEAENIAGEEQSDDPNRLIPATMTQEEGEDVAYLNTYPVWEVDKMKSEMGKSLMAAIQAGDIDAVVNNDYYTVTGRATNEKAILVANLIWRAKGSYSDGSNRRIMRSAVKNGQIDLRTLSDNLAKRRPAEKENTSPRPSR